MIVDLYKSSLTLASSHSTIFYCFSSYELNKHLLTIGLEYNVFVSQIIRRRSNNAAMIILSSIKLSMNLIYFYKRSFILLSLYKNKVPNLIKNHEF
jgi:hypothetical protein